MRTKKLLVLTDETIKNLIRNLIYVFNPNYVLCIDAMVLYDTKIYKCNKEFMTTFYPTATTEYIEPLIEIETIFTNILRTLLPQYNIEVNDVYWHSYLDYRDGEFFTTCYLDLNCADSQIVTNLWEDLACVAQFDPTYYPATLSYEWEEVSILNTTDITKYLKDQLKQNMFLANSSLELRMYAIDDSVNPTIRLKFDKPKYFYEIEDFIAQLRKPQSMVLDTNNIADDTTYKEMTLNLDYFYANISKVFDIPKKNTILCCANALLICAPSESGYTDLAPTNKLTLGGLLNIEIQDDDEFF